MADQLPTPDQLYSQATGPGSADDLYDEAMKSNRSTSPALAPGYMIQDHLHKEFTNQGPYDGSLSDYLFTQSSVGRILSAFGQGAKQNWGAGDSALQTEWQKEASPEAQKNDGLIQKAFNTAVMRPLAAAMDTVYKLPNAIGGGISGALNQAGEEADKNIPVVGRPLGEILSGFSQGAGLEGGVHEEAPIHDATATIQEARAHGVVGEGEEGYFGLKEPQTPEREEAAKDAGVPVPEPIKQAMPTVGDLARQVNPDLYTEVDRLKALQDHLRQSVDYWTNKTGPEGEEIANTRAAFQDVDYKLRDLIPEQSAARERVESLMNSEGPEGAAYRDFVQSQAFENAIKLQELQPDMTDAQRHASDLLESSQETKTPEGPEDKTSDAVGDVEDLQKENVKQQGEPIQGVQDGAVLPEIEGTGDLKIRGTSRHVESEAISKELTESFGDLPTYHSLNMKDVSDSAIEFVKTNPELADKVGQGQPGAPAGIPPEAVWTVLKEQAKASGDVEALRRLATSPLTSQITTMAQRLRVLADAYDTDPVRLIQQLNESKRNAKGGLRIDGEIDNVQNQIKASVNQAIADFKPDWDAFISSISCKE